MSKVISFRLNKDNPRERKASHILVTWCKEGFSVRQVITEALIKLEDVKEEASSTQISELNNNLNKVDQLLEQLINRESNKNSEFDGYSIKVGLEDHFIASIRKTVKEGIKFD